MNELKTVIQSLINEDRDAAEAQIKQYILDKTRDIAGLAESTSDWRAAAIEGYFAFMDPDGNWTPESVFAFKDQACAKACEKELNRNVKDSDFSVKLSKVDDAFIVLMFDSDADMDEVQPLGWGESRSSLERRLRKEIKDGELNIDAELFDDHVEFQRVQSSGKV